MSSTTKGIILAAGKGTRLMPATLPAPKPLLPLYDKPMIYYPLEALIRIGIKDILFIVQQDDLLTFQNTFGSGEHVGLAIMRDRAEQIGGHIAIESEPGEGVRVILSFNEKEG